MGVQAPARTEYCPNFLAGIAAVARHPETAATFSRFRSPWLFRETPEAYPEVFRSAGFLEPFARIEAATARYSPKQVLKVFESGAAAGYLNAACYEGPVPEGYAQLFRSILGESFRSQAGSDGLVELLFYRLYLLAIAPSAGWA